jgi:hypothetical protein
VIRITNMVVNPSGTRSLVLLCQNASTGKWIRGTFCWSEATNKIAEGFRTNAPFVVNGILGPGQGGSLIFTNVGTAGTKAAFDRVRGAAEEFTPSPPTNGVLPFRASDADLIDRIDWYDPVKNQHFDIRFASQTNGVEILSPIDGTIQHVRRHPNQDRPNLDLYDVDIASADGWSMTICLEPDTEDRSYKDTQEAWITARPGDTVKAGDTIGRLVTDGPRPPYDVTGAHISWQVWHYDPARAENIYYFPGDYIGSDALTLLHAIFKRLFISPSLAPQGATFTYDGMGRITQRVDPDTWTPYITMIYTFTWGTNSVVMEVSGDYDHNGTTEVIYRARYDNDDGKDFDPSHIDGVNPWVVIEEAYFPEGRGMSPNGSRSGRRKLRQRKKKTGETGDSHLLGQASSQADPSPGARDGREFLENSQADPSPGARDGREFLGNSQADPSREAKADEQSAEGATGAGPASPEGGADGADAALEDLMRQVSAKGRVAAEKTGLIPPGAKPDIFLANPSLVRDSGWSGIPEECPDLRTREPANSSSALGKVLERLKAIDKEIDAIVVAQFASDAARDVAIVAKLGEMVAFYTNGAHSIRKAVLARLERRMPYARRAVAGALASKDANTVEASLVTLGYLDRKADGSVKKSDVARIIPLVSSRDNTIRKAALKALRLLDCGNAKAALMRELRRCEGNEAFPVIMEICYTRDPAMMDGMLDHIKRTGRSINPFISVLVTPAWVAKHLKDKKALEVARKFGYVDAAIYRELNGSPGKEHLRAVGEVVSSIGLATRNLIDDYIAEETEARPALLETWGRRVSVLSRMTLSEGMSETRALPFIAIGDSPIARIDQDLLFAALRRLEPSDVEARATANPFDLKAEKKQRDGNFHYIDTEAFYKELQAFIAKARIVSGASRGSESVAMVLLPYVVADYLSVPGETRSEEMTEEAIKFFARWRFAARALESDGRTMSIRPEFRGLLGAETCKLSDANATGRFLASVISLRHESAWHLALLDPAAVKATDELIGWAGGIPGWGELSYGARGALKLYAYDLYASGKPEADVKALWRRELDVIVSEEAAAKDVLPSEGIEIQSTSVPPDKAYAFKKALDYFGIPSPRRLVFGSTVEASFPPARSSRPFELAIPILHRMGLHENYRHGSAFHISLNGDLGPDAKYIAMALDSFKNEERRPSDAAARHSRLTHVMSKGLIHLNRANQAVAPTEEASGVHTEIRTMSLQNTQKPERGPDGKIEFTGELEGAYRDVLPAAQLLAAALIADNKAKEGAVSETQARAAELWREYREKVGTLYGEEKYHVSKLLEADWYEATGDPDDAGLVAKLNIIKCQDEIVAYRAAHPEAKEASRELAGRMRQLFLEYAGKIREALYQERARIVKLDEPSAEGAMGAGPMDVFDTLDKLKLEDDLIARSLTYNLRMSCDHYDEGIDWISPELTSDRTRRLTGKKTLTAKEQVLCVAELHDGESLRTGMLAGCTALIGHGKGGDGRDKHILYHMLPVVGREQAIGEAKIFAKILKKHGIHSLELYVDGFKPDEERIHILLIVIELEAAAMGITAIVDMDRSEWRERFVTDDVIVDRNGFEVNRSGEKVPLRRPWKMAPAVRLDTKKAMEMSRRYEEGECLYRSREYRAAADEFRALVEYTVHRSSIFVYLVNCLLKIGAIDEAITQCLYARGILARHVSTDEDTNIAKILCVLSHCYEAKSDIFKAINACKDAVGLCPKNSHVRCHLASALFRAADTVKDDGARISFYFRAAKEARRSIQYDTRPRGDPGRAEDTRRCRAIIGMSYARIKMLTKSGLGGYPALPAQELSGRVGKEGPHETSGLRDGKSFNEYHAWGDGPDTVNTTGAGPASSADAAAAADDSTGTELFIKRSWSGWQKVSAARKKDHTAMRNAIKAEIPRLRQGARINFIIRKTEKGAYRICTGPYTHRQLIPPDDDETHFGGGRWQSGSFLLKDGNITINMTPFYAKQIIETGTESMYGEVAYYTQEAARVFSKIFPPSCGDDVIVMLTDELMSHSGLKGLLKRSRKIDELDRTVGLHDLASAGIGGGNHLRQASPAPKRDEPSAEGAMGAGPASPDARQGIDIELCSHDKTDTYFPRAVEYFNKHMAGKPVDWEEILTLYEKFRGDDLDPMYTPDIRKLRLETVRKKSGEMTIDLLAMINQGYRTKEDTIRAAAKVFKLIVGTPVGQFFTRLDSGDMIGSVGLPGFDKIFDLAGEDGELSSHTANGHHRLGWFMMNYVLMNNGLSPVYFPKKVKSGHIVYDMHSSHREIEELLREKTKDAAARPSEDAQIKRAAAHAPVGTYAPSAGKQEGDGTRAHLGRMASRREIEGIANFYEDPQNQNRALSLVSEANIIHGANLALAEPVPEKTLVCHIITESIVPESQHRMLNSVAEELRKDKYPEKIISLAVSESDGADEFMRKLEAAKGQKWIREYLDKGYTIKFDVACPRQDLVQKVQEAGMQALAFKVEGEGDIVQVEGIIMALRALGTGKMDELLKAFKLLSGKDASVSANDIMELARKLSFILPLRKIDTNRIGAINKIMEKHILAAA